MLQPPCTTQQLSHNLARLPATWWTSSWLRYVDDATPSLTAGGYMVWRSILTLSVLTMVGVM